MSRIFQIIFICLVFQTEIIAQEVQFSQLFADRLYLNPAFAGIYYCPKFMAGYRNQWPGVQFPYVTYNATFDKYSVFMHGGIGVRVMKDEQGQGTFSQFSADLIYSYHVTIGKYLKTKFAFEASLYQKNMSTSHLIFPDMIDPVQGNIYQTTENIPQENFLSPDFSTAFLIHYRNYFVGFSASHIPQNIVENHNEYLPLKITAHAGALIPVLKDGVGKTNFFLEPNIVFIHQQTSNVLYYGMYFDMSAMSVGLFVRQNLEFHFDALVVSYHINFNKITVGYSYDVQLSGMIKQTLGTHEISLAYQLACDKKIRNYNTISCPSF
jgi:type IX secretion system PorP/SprF family membrane protein